ncbi:T9SS C-terminal target domain-containing protein [Neolewinella persica]|uniref:T9SS C-terminal target domain-containing protein n=1 Tax=Neolewinella persica TaxID=70998 RepID=UPI00037D9FB6|nr:T9SS C-terminal target domain-containing protein [Neolewinella persica]
MRVVLPFCTLILALASTTLTAQARQAEHWHFGQELAVSFASGSPVLNPPSAMDGFEGVVSMSDTSGNLLFYTNGGGRVSPAGTDPDLIQNTGIIWNRNHEVMYDMRGLEGGGFSARQSAIAMPAPSGERGIYYLFTMEETEFNRDSIVASQPLGRGLSYFIIDMNLNGGLGGVRTADQRVYVPAYEALDATPMADGTGYWIICHNANSINPLFVVVPLTSTGVGPPVEYPTRPVGGKLEFSPDGSMLFHRGILFAFDNATGAIGAELAEFPGVTAQAACFTPDSRFLYATEDRPVLGEIIVRYDLSNFTTQAIERLRTATDRIVIATAPFQIGPNGNIYFIEQTLFPDNQERSLYGLSEINCVSSPEPSVNRYLVPFEQNGPTPFQPQTLPNYVDAIFAIPPVPDTIRLTPDTVYGCDTSPLTLRPRETGLTYSWSDGSRADTLSVSAAGTYCVTITQECSPVIECWEVRYESTATNPTLTGSEDRGCEGVYCLADLGITLNVEEVIVVISRPNPVGSPIPVFLDTFPDGMVAFPKPKEGQTLSFLIQTINCGPIILRPAFDFPEDDRFLPEFLPVTDQDPCNGRDFTLEIINPGSLAIESVRWEDGNTDNPRTLTAEFGTTYPVTVTNECGDSTLLVYDGLDIAEFCECEGRVPELITPNGDGTNEKFRLFSNCPAESYTLIIFNRWGQQVFTSTNQEEAWDGTINGTYQNTDTYLYRMAFRFPGSEKVEVREGQFSLIR